MIDAQTFLVRAHRRDLSWFAGVPCSFLGPLIDAATYDESVDYLGAANEGDAVAMAAGAFLGGRRSAAIMQNSGLGNAVSPITSLTWPFRIPVLLLVTLRGDPELGDEPQHELMGQITGDLLDQMKVPWTDFPREDANIEAVLDLADRHLADEERPFALIVRKGTLAPTAARERSGPPDAQPREVRSPANAATDARALDMPRHQRRDALRAIVDQTSEDDTVVIAATGYTGRELFATDDRPNHLYMVGSMGCAASLGLGLANARPDLRVVVVDGDGGALMRMGNFATVGAYGGPNLVHLVLDNGAHDSTGGQATVSGSMSFPDVAAACGYSVCRGSGLDPIERALGDWESTGPRFAHVRVRPGTPAGLPRPTQTPHAVRERFMNHIGSLVA